MKHTQKVLIEVNGKSVEATITVDAPGLDCVEDCLNASMILSAAARGQNTAYHSRHHKDRVAHVLVNPAVRINEQAARTELRLVA